MLKVREFYHDTDKNISVMTDVCTDMLALLREGLKNQDKTIYEKLKEKDKEVNELYHKITMESTFALAKYEPKATDLRRIIAIMHLVIDMERVGDHLVKVAYDFKKLRGDFPQEEFEYYDRAFGYIKWMLDNSIESFLSLDIDLAKQVIKKDEKINVIRKDVIKKTLGILEEGNTAYRGYFILNTIRRLERLADHAANISNLVYFVVFGSNRDNPDL